MGHLFLVIVSGIFLSGYFAGVDATIGGNCPGGDADCTAGNNEVCSTDGSNLCVCDAGYTDNSGTCDPVDCGALPPPGNGAVDTSAGTTFGSQATFSCDPGYSSADTATSDCQADTDWSVTSYTCEIKDCGGLTAPGNGAVDTSAGTTFESQATFSCNTGYSSADTATSDCEAGGAWSVTSYTCTIEDCGAPTVADGTPALDSAGVTTYQATATVTCDAGFGLSTDTATHTITCQAGGSWSTLPTCTAGDAADCGAPSPPTNGAISTPATANTEGHDATVACDTGYTLDGASTMTCQHDATWSTPGTCSDCGAVSDPADGTTELDTAGVMTVGATATVTCNTGFELSTGAATATITCQADASWSTLPTCNAGPISVTWSFSVLLLLGAMTRLMKE